jgi:hypothetical protein
MVDQNAKTTARFMNKARGRKHPIDNDILRYETKGGEIKPNASQRLVRGRSDRRANCAA